jgi:hypothetical protein
MRSIVVSTFCVDFGGYFLPSGPFITGFGLVSFACGPPNICFALAILSFSYGVMSFFFYYGLAGGITTTGPLTAGFYYFFAGEGYFLALRL